MAIDTTTPEGRDRERRNASLITARRHTQQALSELEYLIMATPTGERRNLLTDINIRLMEAEKYLSNMKSEES